MTVAVAHDRCGAPLTRLSDGLWIHVLPVTVYHVERWIWTSGPDSEDMRGLLQEKRPTPEEASEPWALWALGVGCGTATAMSRWLGGRLPTLREWREAAHTAWTPLNLREAADGGDDRIRRLVRRLSPLKGGSRSSLLAPDFGELVTESIGGSTGAMHLMRPFGADSLIPGDGRRNVCLPHAGFCCVFEDQGDNVLRS